MDTLQMEVAETILRQLGGRKFVVMTGARNLLADINTLSFRLPGSGGFCKNGINRVQIVLDPSDTYTMTFQRIRGSKITDVAQHHGVYFDMLQSLFTSETGLAVSL